MIGANRPPFEDSDEDDDWEERIITQPATVLHCPLCRIEVPEVGVQTIPQSEDYDTRVVTLAHTPATWTQPPLVPLVKPREKRGANPELFNVFMLPAGTTIPPELSVDDNAVIHHRIPSLRCNAISQLPWELIGVTRGCENAARPSEQFCAEYPLLADAVNHIINKSIDTGEVIKALAIGATTYTSSDKAISDIAALVDQVFHLHLPDGNIDAPLQARTWLQENGVLGPLVVEMEYL